MGDLVRYLLALVAVVCINDGIKGMLDAIETIDCERILSSTVTTRILFGLLVSDPRRVG
jgi:hypothetical protein